MLGMVSPMMTVYAFKMHEMKMRMFLCCNRSNVMENGSHHKPLFNSSMRFIHLDTFPEVRDKKDYPHRQKQTGKQKQGSIP